MLPSRGYFKKNDCPFFEKGSCERPHCHFRHRKKTVSENASSTVSQDLTSIKDSINVNTANTEQDSNRINNSNQIDAQPSHCSKENEPKQDSLFAKLVNQSNSYEKISRHIPCAYTPTPQNRRAQPKIQTVSGQNNANQLKAKEILEKTSKYSGSSNLLKTEHNKCGGVTSQGHSLSNITGSITCSGKQESKNNDTVNSSNSLLSETSEYKISLFETKDSNSLSYEPHSNSKSLISDLNKNLPQGSVLDYVPSKITVNESHYTPYSSNTSFPDNYIPSKESKSNRVQYVPESSSINITNEVSYEPSDKALSKETQYQPGNCDIVADYIPSEKSATEGSGKNNSEWPDFDFLSSQIELMKKLLKDECAEQSSSNDEIMQETDSVSDKEKKKESLKESLSPKRHRSSSSRHKSSHSHSSSKSKHSSSHSSKRSSHRSRSRSDSSRRHSSNSSQKAKISEDREKGSSSKGHRSSENRNSSTRESSRHRSTHKSHKREIEKRADSKNEDHQSEKKKPKSDSNSGDHIRKTSSETENDCESKKRKNSWSDSERSAKIPKDDEDSAILSELEDDPDTIEKECLEIFNNYSKTIEQESSASKQSNQSQDSAVEENENVNLGKKRTAHSSLVMSDHSVLRHKTARKLNSVRSAHEVMMERYKKIEMEKNAKETTTSASVFQPPPIAGLNRPAIRIAAVSNIQQMLNAKKAIQEKIDRGMKVYERTTIAQTVAHGSTRVAHTPASKAMVERPTIKVGSKQITVMKRQIYLDKLLLETNQIYPTKEESAEEALRLEEEVFRAHSGSFPAYHTAYMSMLLKTKRRISAVKGETSSSNSTRPKISHSDVLAGGKKNFSVIKTKKMDFAMLSERHIYEELLRCKLTPEELRENSYPMNGKKPGYATCVINMDLKYNAHYAHIKKMTGNRRYCIRCSKQYEVDPDTLRQYKEGPETCSYHPGRKKSGGRNSDRIYNCCNSSSTEGCATHVRHVTDCNDYENLPNCVKTFPKKHETNPGIFALDCEMVYTRMGYELARVTVVNLKKEIVYDTLVKPKYPVDCYNTSYSGIEEKMLEGVKTTLKDVQAVLLNMFSDKTILIGHSLDSDLRALHLIHDTVVDTSVVYKNEKYHPYKYSLKDLCARKISKIIQDNETGHDSAEDAIAALEIMLNHVKEEISKYDSLESYEADRMT